MKKYYIEGTLETPVIFAVLGDTPADALARVEKRNYIEMRDTCKPELNKESLTITKVQDVPLEPCPFCGSPAEAVWVSADCDYARDWVRIQCSNKYCRGKVDCFSSDADLEVAANRWNERPRKGVQQ